MSARSSVMSKNPPARTSTTGALGRPEGSSAQRRCGQSDSKTAVLDRQRRKRRSPCTRGSSRRARRNAGLSSQRGDVEGAEQRRWHGQRCRLIALLAVTAVFGTQVGELRVHRAGHVFAVHQLQSAWFCGHLHRRRCGCCCDRLPRAGVSRHHQLSQQQDPDHGAADRPQKVSAHQGWPLRPVEPAACRAAMHQASADSLAKTAEVNMESRSSRGSTSDGALRPSGLGFRV